MRGKFAKPGIRDQDLQLASRLDLRDHIGRHAELKFHRPLALNTDRSLSGADHLLRINFHRGNDTGIRHLQSAELELLGRQIQTGTTGLRFRKRRIELTLTGIIGFKQALHTAQLLSRLRVHSFRIVQTRQKVRLIDTRQHGTCFKTAPLRGTQFDHAPAHFKSQCHALRGRELPREATLQRPLYGRNRIGVDRPQRRLNFNRLIAGGGEKGKPQ